MIKTALRTVVITFDIAHCSDRNTQCHEGVGPGEGVSPSPVGVGSGEGAVPFRENFFCILPLRMVHFGALFMLFSTVNWHNNKRSK